MSIGHAAADHVGGGDIFDQLVASCRQEFERSVWAGTPLFTTDATVLYAVYLAELPASERQVHTCHCCRRFIEKFGGLVTIDPDTGVTRSALWNCWDAAGRSEPYKDAIFAMMSKVENASVTGVFVSSQKVWGTPKTGDWTHLSVTPLAENVHRDRLLSDSQAMAQKLQDFGTLSHGLADFSYAAVKQAVGLLESESLYRSEKVAGPARFLLDLHARIEKQKGRLRKNIIWAAVAKAPVGFATPRSAMVGTLLEDISAGKPFDTVKRNFAAKMNPLQYQRPQAPASAGNIAQAEAIVAKLGIEKSLQRRYARLEELNLIWKPTVKQPTESKGGVFGHLSTKSAESFDHLVGAVQAITWVKFAQTVLPHAERMMVKMKHANMPFVGMLTAVHEDAPPILQWDSDEKRNPFSSYIYVGGSTPDHWSLPSSGYVDVTGVTFRPSMWSGDDRFEHFGKSAIFVLDGAKDKHSKTLCLFPETLKSDLHSIRSTIEAFSKAGKIEGQEDASANGILVGSQVVIVRVKTFMGTVIDCGIDRWD